MNATSTLNTARRHPLENRVPPPLVVALIGAAMAVVGRLTPTVEIDGGLRLAVGGMAIALGAWAVVQGPGRSGGTGRRSTPWAWRGPRRSSRAASSA